VLALTDDEALADTELDCPTCAVTVVIPALIDNELDVPTFAVTVVPVDTTVVVGAGGGCVGGADV